jgi:hypothetical protein
VRRTARIRRGCVWALVGVAVLIALVPWQGILWDGGFPDVECRLKFVDRDGKPVSGVTLTVFTKAGAVCHFYPVDEFVPDRLVVSDSNGELVFHHTAGYLEFGGHEYGNLVGMRFGETASPQYDCVFTHGDREVFRTPFNFHRREWDAFRKPTVTRQWVQPWDDKRHGPRPDEDGKEWEHRLFWKKARENMDREERTAAGNFARRFGEKAQREEDGKAPATIEFIVVERTISIPNS